MTISLHDGYYISPVQDGDQPAYVEHLRDRETTDYLLRVPFPYTQEDAESWVRHCTGQTAIGRPSNFAFRRPDGFLIGSIGLVMGTGPSRHRAELGYWLAKDYRGRGLATAGTRAVVRFGFSELDLKRIEATTSTENQPSQKVLEKAGFTREAFLAAYHFKDGNLIDVYLFSLLETQLRSRQ
jgi:RimJ/RimL family protein N-acetyltransferase